MGEPTATTSGTIESRTASYNLFANNGVGKVVPLVHTYDYDNLEMCNKALMTLITTSTRPEAEGFLKPSSVCV